MYKQTVLFLIGILSLSLPPAFSQNEQTIRREILDWSKCNPRVVQIEFVDKLEAGGQTLSAGRRDAVLALVKIEGKAPMKGSLAVAPGSFGAVFDYRGATRIELSKAWGIKGKNVDTGKTVETWVSDPNTRMSVGAEAGDAVGVWFAVAVPKEVKSFYVIIPSLLKADVVVEK